MAVKTITIDMEAYEKLSKEKMGNESFSQVIKRIVDSRKMTAEKLLESLERYSLSDETLTRLEEIVRERELSYPKHQQLNKD